MNYVFLKVKFTIFGAKFKHKLILLPNICIKPFADLVLFEVRSHSPTLIIGQSMAVLLEQGIHPGNSTIP